MCANTVSYTCVDRTVLDGKKNNFILMNCKVQHCIIFFYTNKIENSGKMNYVPDNPFLAEKRKGRKNKPETE